MQDESELKMNQSGIVGTGGIESLNHRAIESVFAALSVTALEHPST
jgi:hypothetical protein